MGRLFEQLPCVRRNLGAIRKVGILVLSPSGRGVLRGRMAPQKTSRSRSHGSATWRRDVPRSIGNPGRPPRETTETQPKVSPIFPKEGSPQKSAENAKNRRLFQFQVQNANNVGWGERSELHQFCCGPLWWGSFHSPHPTLLCHCHFPQQKLLRAAMKNNIDKKDQTNKQRHPDAYPDLLRGTVLWLAS